MAVEVEDLYSNLNKLLDDICKFLTEEATYEKLSPSARKQADELISRSKQQLQEIAKVGIDSDYGAYVDMDRKSDETPVVSTPPSVDLPQSNPYANLPAKELSQDIKYGALSWKYKFILKFDKVRRIYAGVHKNWLLVYASEKDCKPLHTFNLQFHKAQVVASKNKNSAQDFELVCTARDGKTYYFLALTHKDMLQWTSHINRCYDNLNKSDNISISEENISEEYDTVGEGNKEETLELDEEDEECIYQEPIFINPTDPKPQPPNLPVRRFIKPNTPLPPIPKVEEDEESPSIYDSVSITSGHESSSSFSEDDEEDIYEEFVSESHVQESPLNVLQSSSLKGNEGNVNSLNTVISNSEKPEKPKTPVKPKILKDKPNFILGLRK